MSCTEGVASVHGESGGTGVDCEENHCGGVRELCEAARELRERRGLVGEVAKSLLRRVDGVLAS